MRWMVLLAMSQFVIACSSPSPKVPETVEAPKVKALPTNLQEAVQSDYRTPENKKRDVYRHPAETLDFFGVKPDMTVVEVWPSTGWYTEILAPYLAQKGHYFAAQPTEFHGNSKELFEAWILQNHEVAAKMTTTQFAPPKIVEIAPAGSADVVLTFRNIHNWMMKDNQDIAFKAFFKALKHGGILGVVEHRADSKTKNAGKGKSGYVSEADVIRFAKKAGFELMGKSEINANPLDTKDYPEGVWTLPPTYRLKDKDREKYAAIGESDRMTLKFVKP